LGDEVVKVEELRRSATLLFDYLEKSGYTSFPLEKDFYWLINEKQRYDPVNDPTDIGLGQLYDDLDFLRGMLREDRPIAYGLVYLSSLLTYIGETVKLNSIGD
jgi:hypothetical protein